MITGGPGSLEQVAAIKSKLLPHTARSPHRRPAHRRFRLEHDSPPSASARLTDEVPSIRLDTVIAAPIGDCFDLSLSVDAHTASMSQSGERAIGGVTSGVMKLGDTVTWRARHFGLAFLMTCAITEYDYPSRFVDEQQRGPFQRWWHEHTFTATAPGATHMTDVVEFRSPLGLLGSVADRLVLDHYMPRLLRQRNAWLKNALEARSQPST
jgi:ligand-binding SRPBCC domain-containing protein